MAKRLVRFACEVCETVFRDLSSARKCEATHLGITYEEYLEYIRLRADVKQASSSLLNNSCEESRGVFDLSIDKCTQYEHDKHMCQDALKRIQFDVL